EQPRPFARRQMLGLDRGRPDVPREPARAPPLVPGRGVGLEPVGPLPTRLLAERRAELAKPRIGWREAEPPSLLPLLVRVAQVVVRAVDLVRSLEREAAGAILRAEAPEVHVPDVQSRIALDDPVGHDPAHAAGAGDAVGAEAARDEEAADLWGLTEDELAVGRERLGAVDQPDDLGGPDCRDPVGRPFHQL